MFLMRPHSMATSSTRLRMTKVKVKINKADNEITIPRALSTNQYQFPNLLKSSKMIRKVQEG